MTIIDGCEWTRHDTTQYFKNKKELNKYIDCCRAAMDDVIIRDIEKIKGI